MSTKRKITTGSPIPRPHRLVGWSLEALADETGASRIQALTLLREAVKRGEAIRVDCAGRALWAEAPRRDVTRRRRGAVQPFPPLLGITAESFAQGMGIAPAEALLALQAAMDCGQVARIRTGGREVYARIGGGAINEFEDVDRHPIRINERNAS